MSTNKRCRLSVSLGAQYKAFVSMCKKQDCKPSALASYILKSMVQEEVRISDDPQIKNHIKKFARANFSYVTTNFDLRT